MVFFQTQLWPAVQLNEVRQKILKSLANWFPLSLASEWTKS